MVHGNEVYIVDTKYMYCTLVFTEEIIVSHLVIEQYNEVKYRN